MAIRRNGEYRLYVDLLKEMGNDEKEMVNRDTKTTGKIKDLNVVAQ